MHKYLFGCPNPILFCFYVLSYNRTVNPENFSSLYRKTKILKFWHFRGHKCPFGGPNPKFFCFYVLPYHGSVNPENFSSLSRKTKILEILTTFQNFRTKNGAPNQNSVPKSFLAMEWTTHPEILRNQNRKKNVWRYWYEAHFVRKSASYLKNWRSNLSLTDIWTDIRTDIRTDERTTDRVSWRCHQSPLLRQRGLKMEQP